MEKQQLENLTQAYLKVLGLVEEEKVESLDEKCATKKEEIDPVDKKALKKDFKDREDKDIDNDGDEDESDEYLHNRRKAVSKAVKEEAEQVDELTKSTLGSYVKKANQSAMSSAHASGAKTTAKAAEPHIDKMFKRKAGINKAVDRLTKEDVEEVDEAKQPHKFGDTWKSYDAIKKIFDRGRDKNDWTPDEVASVKKHVKVAGRKERGLHQRTGPWDWSAGAMHDHIVKHAKQPVKEEVELDEAIHSSQKDFAGERSHKDATNYARAMHRTLVSKGYNTRTVNHLSSNEKDASAEYHHPDKPSKTMHIRHLNLGNKTQSSSVALHSKTSANKLGEATIDQLGISFEELEEFIMSEEFNQLDEISQDTLRRYHGAAALDLRKKREKLAHGTMTTQDHKQGQRRVVGLNRAANKMESTDNESKYGQHAGMLIDYVQEARENHGNMNNGSPQGEGLSPNAKKEKERKVEIAHDAEKANMQNFKDFTAKVGVAKKRPNDNDVGDKKVVK